MPDSDHSTSKASVSNAGRIWLSGDASAAIGLVKDASIDRPVVLRTDVQPRLRNAQLGRSSVTSLQLGAFEATMPDSRSPQGNDWMGVLLQCTGSTRFESCDYSGVSAPGHLVMFDHNVETKISSESNSTRIVAVVPKAALPAPNFKRLDGIVHMVDPRAGLPRIFSHLLRATSRDAHALNATERMRVDRSLLYAVSDLLGSCETTTDSKSSRSLSQIRTAALHLIETDINGLNSVAELAQKLDCSERSIFSAFREVGISPGRHILMLRLKRASIAIQTNPATSIAEIAFASGFQSYSHFSRVFKAMYGYSPVSIRQNILQVVK